MANDPLDDNSQNGLEITNQTINGGKQQFADVINQNRNVNATSYIEGNDSGNVTGNGINLNRAEGDIVHGDKIIHYPPAEPKVEIAPDVNIRHLPEPTTALIGRKTELAQLTEAFVNPDKRLAIIVAAGGIGKSALTDAWLQCIAKHNYYGKTRVFGWSFYSQGSHNTFTNSQPFFSAVLPFLGVTEIPKDEIEKARLLAKCLQQQPCLLILDGLEPLQYAENLSAMNGEVQDSALREFIACFRRMAGKSFVLMSSRQPLVELKKWQAEHYLSLDLKTLPHQEGADLLQALGVTGKAAERQTISQDLNGHALSLVLMGHLLSEHHQGDCRYAKELPSLTSAHGDSDAEKDSRHALRVLDYYDSLQDEASRCFLQLLGLFDRPMNREEKAVLIAGAHHAEPLRALTAKQWQAVEQRLEKSGLLLGKKGAFERLEWDTHPIIRVYFGEKFKDDYPEAFKQAHLVLFNCYQKLPKKELPDTLEEMLPLYRAVVHGCWAGEYKNALNEVYFRRICKGIYYSEKYLGAYSQDLSVLQIAISEIKKGKASIVPEAAITNILATISSCLMSLGRLNDAIKYIKDVIKRYSYSTDEASYHCIAISYQNLVELYFVLGRLDFAEKEANEAIKYSVLSKNQDCLIVGYNYLATTYHLMGKLKESEELFQYAEKSSFSTQRQWYSENSIIVSSRYFDLQIDRAKNKVDRKNILKKCLDHEIQARYDKDLFLRANDYLTLAVCCVANENEDAELFFNDAIRQVEKSNAVIFIPEFYLYRADFYLTQNQLAQAQDDLNSAWEIIERCGMKLYAVDYLLIHGRYCLASKDYDTALNHYEEVKQLIHETGYHLRDAELDLFAAKLRQQDKPEYQPTNPGLYSQTADYYLQKAKNRIEEIGQWGLMRVIERDFPEGAFQ